MPEAASPVEASQTVQAATAVDRLKTSRVIIPDHELIRLIGRGAYGEVWLARNSATGILRAAKVVYRDKFSDQRPFNREFEGIRAFEEVSRSHPSQLALFHVGRNEAAGYFYYLMELADDATEGKTRPAHIDSYEPSTLRRELESGRLAAARVLEVGLVLAEALTYLHGCGLIHRDVKPSNIIFVKGRAKLADIGLVTGASDELSIVGTEGYLPQEGPGTVSADLFALGKVLYEALSGMDRRRFPELPGDLRKWPDTSVALELNAVIVKACAPQPGDRYVDGKALLADLTRLREGGSVKRARLARAWVKTTGAASLVCGVFAATIWAGGRLSKTRSNYVESSKLEVNQLIAKGNQALREETPEAVNRAGHFFGRARDLDPSFIPALYGVAAVDIHQDDAAHWEDLREITAEILRIDPDCSEGWQLKALLEWMDRRYLEAVTDAKYATSRRAYCTTGEAWSHGAYGLFLQCTGHPNEALAEYRIAEKIDSAEPTILDHLGQPYLMQGRLEEALGYFERSLELQPKHPNALSFKAVTLEAMGRFEEAIVTRTYRDEVTGRLDESHRRFYDELLQAYRERGAPGYWRKRLDLESASSNPDLYQIARFHAHLGEMSEAYAILEQAKEGNYHLGALLVDLCWNRNDPWFKRFVIGVGLVR